MVDLGEGEVSEVGKGVNEKWKILEEEGEVGEKVDSLSIVWCQLGKKWSGNAAAGFESLAGEATKFQDLEEGKHEQTVANWDC